MLGWPLGPQKCGLSLAMEAGSPSPPTSDGGEDEAVPVPALFLIESWFLFRCRKPG